MTTKLEQLLGWMDSAEYAPTYGELQIMLIIGMICLWVGGFLIGYAVCEQRHK